VKIAKLVNCYNKPELINHSWAFTL
jgi:hypothetical protein